MHFFLDICYMLIFFCPCDSYNILLNFVLYCFAISLFCMVLGKNPIIVSLMEVILLTPVNLIEENQFSVCVKLF